VADVPKVAVAAVNLGRRRGGRDVPLLQVIEHREAAGEVPPRITPRGDDLHLGSESPVRGLEPHLVVALARAAVRQSRAPGLLRDLDLAPREDGAGDRGAEEVTTFVDAAGDDRRHHKLVDELGLEVDDVALGRAGVDGFLLNARQLIGALPDVTDDADDLRARDVLFEPRHDAGGVEAARIRQRNPLTHLSFLPVTL